MNRKLALILGIMFITMAFLCACGNNGVDQSTEAQSAEQNNETETMDHLIQTQGTQTGQRH